MTLRADGVHKLQNLSNEMHHTCIVFSKEFFLSCFKHFFIIILQYEPVNTSKASYIPSKNGLLSFPLNLSC